MNITTIATQHPRIFGQYFIFYQTFICEVRYTRLCSLIILHYKKQIILGTMRRSKTASSASRNTQKNFVKEGATYKVNKQTEKHQLVPGTYTLHQ